MKRHAKVLFAVAMLCGVLLSAASASAQYVEVGAFAGPGSGDGELTGPERIAVEQATGNLFVVDSGNDRVQVFAPDGTGGAYLTQFGSGVLDEPLGIAIDESGGQTLVYVTSQSNGGEILKFDSDEAATPSFSLDASYASPDQGTDPDQVESFRSAIALAPGGDLWIADSGANVLKRFDPSGAHVTGSNFDGSNGGSAFTGLLDLAVNPTGDLYLIDANGPIERGPSGTPDPTGTSQAHRYGSDGAYQATLMPVGESQRPATVAVDRATGNVAVSGEQDAINRDQNPTVHVFDAANTPLEEFRVAGPSPYETVSALAFSSDPERLLVVTDFGYDAGGTSWGSQPGVQAYIDADAPAVVVQPATEVTTTSALLHATIDTGGANTQYRFEVFRNGDWSPLDPDNDGNEFLSGSNAGPQAVSEAATGLEPSTAYRVRVRATNAVGETIELGPSFTASPSAPTVRPRPAADITADSVSLRASIDPNGRAAIYRFEYGPGGSYGSTTPARSTGAGNDSRLVDAPITGLSPSSTYHFRVVATNATGTVEGPEQVFTTAASNCSNAAVRAQQESEHLPECRAYEMVSPSDETSNVNIQPEDAVAAADGDGIYFTTKIPLGTPDASAAPTFTGYIAKRQPGSANWASENVTPPGEITGELSPLFSRIYRGLSSDLKRGVILSDGAPLAPGGPTDAALYRSDLTASTFSTITPFGASLTTFVFPYYVGASEDFSRIFFQTAVPNADGVVGGQSNVYEWTEGGVELAGRLPDAEGGGPVPNGTFAPGPNPEASDASYEKADLRNIASDDGSRLFFSATDGRLYVRVDGEESYLLNEHENSIEDPGPGQAFFRGASADGSVAIFLSDQRLVDEDANDALDLYAYDTTRPGSASDNLTLISGGAPGTSTVDAFGVRTDPEAGTTIYFLQRGGELLPGLPPAPVPDAKRVYAWSDGQLDFVGFGEESPVLELISADGTKFAFGSNLQPDVPASDLGSVSVDAHFHVYDAETGLSECVSCDGVISDGAQLELWATITGVNPRLRTPLANLSDDGELIFLTTMRLAPGDRNGNFQDVYSWKDGEARLISSGRGFDHNYIASASADHDDVFFLTRDSLDPADRDRSYDLYDARVGGGALKEEPTLACEGEGCQGPPSSAPPEDSVGSRSFAGPERGRQRTKPPAGCAKQSAALARARAGLKKAVGKGGRTKARGRLRNAKAGLAKCKESRS